MVERIFQKPTLITLKICLFSSSLLLVDCRRQHTHTENNDDGIIIQEMRYSRYIQYSRFLRIPGIVMIPPAAGVWDDELWFKYPFFYTKKFKFFIHDAHRALS